MDLSICDPIAPMSGLKIHVAGADVWRPVLGYEGFYVSGHGQVRSLKMGKALKPWLSHRGYPLVHLGGKARFVHSLMLEAFHGPRPSPRHLSRHLNDIKIDNRISNLAWGTKRDNGLDASRNGIGNIAKTHCPVGHEYTPENTMLMKSGSRFCRECGRIRSREHMRAKRANAAKPRPSED